MTQAVGRWPLAAEAGFHPRSAHVRFIVDKVALGQVLRRVLLFSPVSIIPPTLHTHLHLHIAPTRRTKGVAWEPSKTQWYFGNRGELDRKAGLLWPFSLRSWLVTLLLGLSSQMPLRAISPPPPGSISTFPPAPTLTWVNARSYRPLSTSGSDATDQFSPILQGSGHEPHEGLDVKTDWLTDCLTTIGHLVKVIRFPQYNGFSQGKIYR
jgi:hypothetical protein